MNAFKIVVFILTMLIIGKVEAKPADVTHGIGQIQHLTSGQVDNSCTADDVVSGVCEVVTSFEGRWVVWHIDGGTSMPGGFWGVTDIKTQTVYFPTANLALVEHVTPSLVKLHDRPHVVYLHEGEVVAYSILKE